MNKNLNEELIKEAEKIIKPKLELVYENIEKASLRSGRNKNEIQLLAVSKFHSIEEIQAAINLGLHSFGENRVQEAIEKFPYLLEKNPHISLHMIGNLQRNKVKTILPYLDAIHSIDRILLAKEIVKERKKYIQNENKKLKKLKLFLEVHTGEESKNGFSEKDEIWACIDFLLKEQIESHIEIAGFMTMAPFTKNEKEIRISFQKLKSIQTETQKRYPSLLLNELSMGMTNDYEIAIEEGSTLLRIGSAIF